MAQGFQRGFKIQIYHPIPFFYRRIYHCLDIYNYRNSLSRKRTTIFISRYYIEHTIHRLFRLIFAGQGQKKSNDRIKGRKNWQTTSQVPLLNYPLKAITSKSDEPNSEISQRVNSPSLFESIKSTYLTSFPFGHPNFLRSNQK